jgi:hypothetical protein
MGDGIGTPVKNEKSGLPDLPMQRRMVSKHCHGRAV